jgi:Cof subfamily protein (haloacid dehalogenase superfamily)
MTVISRLPLGRDPALRAIDIILRHDLDAWVYDDEDWFVRDAQAPHVAHEAYTLGFAPIVVADVTARLDQVGKIVAVGDDPTAVDRCNLALAAALGGSASATRSQSFFIDITHPDANKGKMVETIAELLRIAPSAVATIGDMPNDVLMFDKSGLSVAMGNATDDVKAKANRTTDSNEDEGFAKAMERLLQDRKEGAA